MIKTIIFDIGGVVKRMNYKAIYSNFALRIGISPKVVINYHKEKAEDLFLGNISVEQFWQDMKNAGGKTDLSYEDTWIEETNKNTEINDDLLLIIQKLRKNYKVGALSNLITSRLFTDEKIDLYSNFDYAVLSCREHLKKPDLAFFRLALEKASAKPNEAIFIDDKEMFTEVARQMGMKTILYMYGDNEKLLNDLKEMGINLL